MAAAKMILIIDDEEDIVKALTIRLHSLGYEVVTAADGLVGLEKIRAEKPDVVLLDIMLPKLDGYKVCRVVKYDENLKDIPIIMLTAKVTDVDKNLGKEVGADEYLTKPFSPEQLVMLIKKYTQRTKK
ncbi:MAG: response regulator [Candidatus Saganbacteria bacterium]|nr:response regulator [Candidatus Saganbacteria bacterium]